MQVPDLLHNPAKRFPDRLAVIEGSRRLTFAEVDRRADQLAAALQARGIEHGDRVALLAMNELEYLEIQVAAQRLGAILVPLNYRLAVPELAYIVRNSGCRLLIHGPGYEITAEGLGVGDNLHLGPTGHGDSYDEALASHTDPAMFGPLQAETPCTILYTSGTTGRPKGAVLSNLSVYARCAGNALELRVKPGDVFVQTLPMFHIAANLAYSFTYVGATLALVREFAPPTVLEVLRATSATHVLLVPTTINMLNNHPGIDEERFDDLRMVLYGASAIAPDVLRRAIEVFGCGFLQFFGMTETSGCSLLRVQDHDPVGRPDLLASAGTDAISFETRVVDQDDRECPPGVVGEIVTRGPALMVGYWNDPAATDQALRGGWMHTGDLGYRSEDGYLFVSDRLKDMIVTGGENVYPREVEDVLYSHPSVLEAAVIGVPDDHWGERVHAIVVARPGHEVTTASLIEHCRGRLAGYKCPKSAELADSLPKNVTGKILKRELRERYLSISPG